MTEPKTVVTISRMYGSGGREVGKQLAGALGLTYYDKELIARAAQESGLDEELVEKAGESTASPLSYLFSYASGTSSVSEDTLPLSDRVYIAQSRIIKQIAREGGCVIVGRCSDYVLEGEVRADTPVSKDGKAWRAAAGWRDLGFDCLVLQAEGETAFAPLISVDAPNVFVEAVKPCEDAERAYIVRLYEAEGAAADAFIRLPDFAVGECTANMLEEPLGPEEGACALRLKFRPFEIKTLKISY